MSWLSRVLDPLLCLLLFSSSPNFSIKFRFGDCVRNGRWYILSGNYFCGCHLHCLLKYTNKIYFSFPAESTRGLFKISWNFRVGYAVLSKNQTGPQFNISATILYSGSDVFFFIFICCFTLNPFKMFVHAILNLNVQDNITQGPKYGALCSNSLTGQLCLFHLCAYSLLWQCRPGTLTFSSGFVYYIFSHKKLWFMNYKVVYIMINWKIKVWVYFFKLYLSFLLEDF